MRLLHPEALGCAPVASRVNHPRHSLTLIAKVMVKLRHGQPCALVQPEEPLFPSADVPYPDDSEARSGFRYDSDFAPWKPGADAMLVGHFWAPGGRPVRLGEAAVTVGARSLRVAVIGKRTWDGSRRWPALETAEPFTSVALRWENAFGGPGFDANPVGRGFVPKGQRGPVELPLIERPEHPYVAPDEPPDPICFAPIRRDWYLRRALLGTFDKRWKETRWPWFPEDFDWRHFHAAVPALRFREYLAGDELLALKNLHPSIPHYESRLPGLKVVAAVQRRVEGGAPGPIEPLSMKLDTLWMDLDAEVASLVWRGTCPTRDADFSDLAFAWASLEPMVALADERQVIEKARAAIAADEALWEIAEEPPPPAPVVALPPPPSTPDEEGPPPDIAAALAALPVTPPTPEEQAQIAAALKASEARLDEELGEADPSDARPPWTRERVRQVLASGGPLAGEDLSGLDLSNEDLSGAPLAGVLLVGAKLTGAKLAGANLAKATLSTADLGGVDLTGANLMEADLSRSVGAGLRGRGAKLAGANLSEIDWPAADLPEADLSGALVRAARMSRANFRGAQLTEAIFERAAAPGASFDGAVAGGVLFAGASLEGATFVGTTLAEADFSGAALPDASFEKADLTDANFEKAQARRTRFTDARVGGLRGAGADLGEAVLRRVTGEAAYFETAKLDRLQLVESDLCGADFSRCDLREAQLSGVTLKGAKFVAADLRGARLVACDCFEALFEAARLDDCDGSDSSFYGAEFLEAEVRRFRGRNRNLTKTKLAGGS